MPFLTGKRHQEGKIVSCQKIEAKSARLKIKLLLNGIRIEETALNGLGTKYKEYQYGYNDSNWLKKNKQQLLPSELLLPGGIVAAPHLRPNSPYIIKRNEKEMFVFNEAAEEYISAIDYLPRPKIWDLTLDDGTPVKNYLNIYGKDCLNLFIVANCEFWNVGLPCTFCSLQPTQKFHEEAEMFKPIEKIQEAVKKAFASGDELNSMIITGGSLINRNEENKRYVDVLNVIQRLIPELWNGKILGNGALIPSCNEDDLKKLFETGIEHPSFNLEVWGQEMFSKHCPGKELYAGFTSLQDTYKMAVKLWGSGEVWCNFVGGISPIENLIQGFKELANIGVVSGANIFHLDPSAPAVELGLKEPTEDYVFDLYGSLNEIYHTYGFKPFFNAGILRNSLSNEFYNGWL